MVVVYVEGGGETNYLKRAVRRAFHDFLGQLNLRDQPRVHPSGSRNDAYDDFCQAVRERTRALLLVDSEGPIQPGSNPWVHVRERDGWRRPRGADKEDCHLMVQCMESWFLADRAFLSSFFGQGFQRSLFTRQSQNRRSTEGRCAARNGERQSSQQKGQICTWQNIIRDSRLHGSSPDSTEVSLG